MDFASQIAIFPDSNIGFFASQNRETELVFQFHQRRSTFEGLGSRFAYIGLKRPASSFDGLRVVDQLN
jgi:hypothetical protein